MICLGIDIGGTGCKCAAFSQEGQQLALAYEEYPLAPGTVDLPPDILIRSVYRVISQCAAQLKDPGAIAAVTVASFGESFVAIDAQGQPLEDIRMYFGSGEGRAFDETVKKVGSDRFMEICRILPDPSYSLAKMLRTLETAPRPVHKFLFIAGYVSFCLSGRAATDVSLACRSLLYDVRRSCWSEELLAAAGIREDQLPEVVSAGTCLGSVLPDIAAGLGIPAGTKVVMGTHDQIVNALGAGVAQTGDAVDASGTCECLTPLFPAIPESRDFLTNNFACVPYLQDRGYVTYAYNISAGSVVKWCRDALANHLKTEEKSVYDVLNETAPAEPTDLLILPFLQGMGGTPETDPSATGLVAGLTTQTRLPDIYRAILEGITFEMRYNLEKLRSGGVAVSRLLACGGGARSSLWLRIKADILGCPILPVRAEETGAMGCAILGFAAVTGEDPLDIAARFIRLGDAIEPSPAHQAVYDKKYEAYKALRRIYREEIRRI